MQTCKCSRMINLLVVIISLIDFLKNPLFCKHHTTCIVICDSPNDIAIHGVFMYCHHAKSSSSAEVFQCFHFPPSPKTMNIIQSVQTCEIFAKLNTTVLWRVVVTWILFPPSWTLIMLHTSNASQSPGPKAPKPTRFAFMNGVNLQILPWEG